MKKLIINLFINAGFVATSVYAVINSAAVIIVEFDLWDKVGWFSDFVLGIDAFTWIVYGVFSIATLLIKLGINSKAVNNGNRKNWLDIQSVLHLIFMLISFGGIYYLFENCF